MTNTNDTMNTNNFRILISDFEERKDETREIQQYNSSAQQQDSLINSQSKIEAGWNKF